MLKVYDINNNELKENIDYRIDGSTIIVITGKVHIAKYSPEVKPNREQRRLNKKLNNDIYNKFCKFKKITIRYNSNFNIC